MAGALCVSAFSAYADGQKLHVVTTGDVHGSWFDLSYTDDSVNPSLFSVKYYLDSLRNAVGEENVLLIDAGDCLQGNNASYYYNFVALDEEHLYSRLAGYMAYDAIVVGNHDIETGHTVYDKVFGELAERGIPWLGGNAVRVEDGEPYFPVYSMYDRGGYRVAVLGFTNPNMKAWLGEELWIGMDFLSLLPCVQNRVNEVIEAENPDVVVVVVHAGTGRGDGSMLESQGLDLLNTLTGVDLLVCAHDHRPAVVENNGMVLLNGGSHARRVGHAVIEAVDGKNSVSAEVVELDRFRVDTVMRAAFGAGYEAVKEFTNRPIGRLDVELRSRDAMAGMSSYINLVHTVQLSVPEALVSFAAPLSFNGVVEAGTVIFNDAFTIYPYENQLYVVRLRGSEIRKYLEYSYNNWIQTPGDHVLKIENRADPRNGTSRWSFTAATYNFDSAAGLIYTVDVSRPYRSRVNILSFADGTPFEEDAWYPVAMTSYRASGGGELLVKGAGLAKEEIDSRIIARYPEIRQMVIEFISSRESVGEEELGDSSVLGSWKFIPEEAAQRIQEDLKLVF